MNRLDQILAVKRDEVAALLPQRDALRKQALARNEFRPFELALRKEHGGLSLIAEVKKASPSAGAIVEEFEPVEIAQAYEAAGADAISVLTDGRFFQGELGHLIAVREAVLVPVLRKDFIIDEVQIYEASCAGADAILLIVAALEQERLLRLLDVAYGCQLDVLMEVHDLPELDRALETDVRIIGINNRNLKTFQIDLETTERLIEEVPEDLILVSESGIKNGGDARRVHAAGANAILVGETLMRSADIEGTVYELIGFAGPQEMAGSEDEDKDEHNELEQDLEYDGQPVDFDEEDSGEDEDSGEEEGDDEEEDY